MRIAYLGPAGTFTEDALRTALGDHGAETVPEPTVHDAILAVDSGEADLALVPFENSIEGAVRSTLDTLAFDVHSVAIVGERDYPIRHSLIARRELPLDEIRAVLSHPQASAQCTRFIREKLPAAEVRREASTPEGM
jgi:prephenate dehydratase